MADDIEYYEWYLQWRKHRDVFELAKAAYRQSLKEQGRLSPEGDAALQSYADEEARLDAFRVRKENRDK